MKRVEISEEQFAALVAEVAKVVLEGLSGSQSMADGKAEPSANKTAKRGRPKSIYTGQLHIRVLPEDEDWYKKTSDRLGVQHGSFLSLLRKSFS